MKRGSVGGDAEMSAMVFMRTKAVPQTLRPGYANGFDSEMVWVPFSGFSGYRSDNFRCAVKYQAKAIQDSFRIKIT